MIPFKVKIDFQHNGVQYEAGNTHKRHSLPDDVVNGFRMAGWIEGGNSAEPADVYIQPDDITINLVGA